jgi:hypothetical protein
MEVTDFIRKNGKSSKCASSKKNKKFLDGIKQRYIPVVKNVSKIFVIADLCFNQVSVKLGKWTVIEQCPK